MVVGSFRSVVVMGVLVSGALVVGLRPAGVERNKTVPPREVTVSGQVVDLQNHMTDKFASTDREQCTQTCLRAGVPAALLTEDGLIVLGKGEKGAVSVLTPLALKNVEVKGMLYERLGLRYLDIAEIKPIKSMEDEEDWPGDEEEDDTEPVDD